MGIHAAGRLVLVRNRVLLSAFAEAHAGHRADAIEVLIGLDRRLYSTM
jgi:hypothetical protein